MNGLMILLGCLFFTDGDKSAAKVKSEIVEKQSMPAPTVLVLKPTTRVNGESETTIEEQIPVAKQAEPIASQLQGNLNSNPETGIATVKTTNPAFTPLTSK